MAPNLCKNNPKGAFTNYVDKKRWVGSKHGSHEYATNGSLGHSSLAADLSFWSTLETVKSIHPLIAWTEDHQGGTKVI